MTEQPEPLLEYATPLDEPGASSAQVIPIVGISLGGFTLLFRLLGFLSGIFLRSYIRTAQMPAGYSIMQYAAQLVFGGFAVWLVVASIGCLKKKEWARRWLVAYAVAYPVALVAEIGVTALTAMPAITKMMAKTTPGAPKMPFTPGTILLLSVGVQVIYALVLMILPAFILICMRKPGVRAMFHP
jgi:hypothetical protein